MIVALGHYPAYVELAQAQGYRYFQIAADVWDRLTPAQQWDANRAFLDDAIAEGAIFVLATAPAAVRPDSWYRRELDYLQSKGYQARQAGPVWELFR